jgi:bifunctional non-homologous end joining protein LigD
MTAIANIEISHPEKVLFPDGTTKADLARYYQRVAEAMLPHVRRRPVHMQRYPDGINGTEIQQKQVPAYFPDFVERVQVKRKRGGTIEQVVIENTETLVYLADQACITPHTWLSRTGALDKPDQLVFDLDPPDGELATLRDGARTLRQLLHDVGLRAYLKSTGSRGFHIVAPLDAGAGFDEARAFARSLAQRVVDQDAERFTLEQRKEQRLPRPRAQRLRPDRGSSLRGARAGGRTGGRPPGMGRAQPRRTAALQRPQRFPAPRAQARPLVRPVRTRRLDRPRACQAGRAVTARAEPAEL